MIGNNIYMRHDYDVITDDPLSKAILVENVFVYAGAC